MAVDKKNVFLVNTNFSLPYSGRPIPVKAKHPVRPNSQQHGEMIQIKINESYERSAVQKKAAAIKYKKGTYLEFKSLNGYDLELKSLENRKQGVRLLNVREEIIYGELIDKENREIIENVKSNRVIKATVYIPEGKENFFIKKFKDYMEDKTISGKPKNNPLVSSIEDISLALLNAFWIGKHDDIPKEQPKWCEVWLRFEGDDNRKLTLVNQNTTLVEFMSCCAQLKIDVSENEIVFPERIVKLIYANETDLSNLVFSCEYIAEFRKAPENITFYEELSSVEQQEWVEDLNERVLFLNGSATICILDTGIAAKHPLISSSVLDDAMIQTVESSWGTYDHEGHGTEMAGIALYYDLGEKLSSNKQYIINHGIESVKILPPSGINSIDLYGAITENAVYLAEIENPKAYRTICMAVTAADFNTDDGSPTSWSAAIDSLVSGVMDNNKRLFFISAGNVHPQELVTLTYPEANILHGVENPGQSWNAITVGAYSEDINVISSAYNGYGPVADVLELSPYSSTSSSWNDKWPIKPEIILNGGNMVTNGFDFDSCEDLALLTTNKNFLSKPLSSIWGTSSATAQASWMSAQLATEYPNAWPETIRALLVHSATWSDKMVKQFCADDKKRTGRKQLLRTCGYGIPNIKRAIECANNSVNLIVQEEIRPFGKGRMNDMHIHEIPWPKEVLKSLGEVDAKLKITLSYFIEPGPGEVGWKNKYRYPSAGLRFDVINSNENQEDFRKRINIKMRGDDKNDSGDGSSRDWFLGTRNRDVGSIHSDYFVVPAVDLCDSGYIAVFPVVGWWRERAHLGKFNKKMRYSLVVSIETPSVDADLYTAIMTQINMKTAVEINI